MEAFSGVLSGDGPGILGPLWLRGPPNWGVWSATDTALHTHSAERRSTKTDKTERSTRHWIRRNRRVTDTFCNCIEDRTI